MEAGDTSETDMRTGIVPEADGTEVGETGVISDISLPDCLDRVDGPLPYDSKHLRRIAGGLMDEAAAVARPMAAWKLTLIEKNPGRKNQVKIGPVTLDNPILTDNLGGLGRVFPFLATEGPELAAWAESLPARERTAAFTIRYLALKEAERRLEEKLTAMFGVLRLGAMSPGVLPAWPLAGQRDLFALLDPIPRTLGVSLRGDSCWMAPDVSSSGLYFETEIGFHNCKLCPLERCPLRRFERQKPGRGGVV
ncbi:MAG: hypothetical protein LBP95_03335 [Deltaproteobacteria bacterium]|jgi:hypothetical protein|nr:hypothetical protein [Deltaproteobacteria bacterium]